MKKFLFITIGVLSVILGIIGIFVPGLPTIRRYESRQGMSLTGKFISIACMWIMISISAFLILEDFKIRVLLLILGAIGTGSILLIVPTAKRQNPGSEEAR